MVRNPKNRRQGRRPAGCWRVGILLLTIAVSRGPSRLALADERRPSVPREGVSHAVDPDARRLYENALEHFRAGELDEALRLLQAAYRIAPAPELLYNLGQASRLKGDCAAALDFYRRFLDTYPTGLALEWAIARKAEMEACVALADQEAQPVSTDADQTPAVSTAPPPKAPPPDQTAGIVAPSATALSFSPAQTETGRPGAAPNRGLRGRTAAALTVAAVTLLLASGYLAWQAHRAADEMSGVFDRGQRWDAQAAANESDGIWSQRLAIGCGATGLLAGGIAAWLWYKDR